MVHQNAVSIDQMREHMVSLDTLRSMLALSEPLTAHSFPTGSGVQFDVSDNWNSAGEDDLCGSSMRTAPATAGGTEYPLTKKALLEAGAFCGIPREYQKRLPADLLKAQLDYWYQQGFGDKTFKMLLQGSEGTVLGLCRDTINPFSNLSLLDVLLAGLEKQYGQGEVLVDYKLHHDLENTQFRLVVPGHQRVITGTRVVGDDTWSTGLHFRNSLIGLKPPQMDGYLFRYWCTNGCYDTLNSVKLARRAIRDEPEALEWASHAVDEVLGGLEGLLDDVQALTQVQVEGDASLVLRDLFNQHHVPRQERARIMDTMADLGGDLTMYDIQQAITQAANLDELSPRTVDILLATGGHVAHAASGRCDRCRRVLPEGYVLPEEDEEMEPASA